MISGPPPLSAVSAYGPPGTRTVAGPPSVPTVTVAGAAENFTWAGPPPVSTLAVAAVIPWANSIPPSVPARSGPATRLIVRGPPPVLTVSGPAMSAIATGPPAESTLARATPDAKAGPPWVATVTLTEDGTVTVKSTSQSEFPQAGSRRISRPPATDSATGGGASAWS